MALPDRLTINLATDDVEISRDEIEELVDEREVSSQSELVRELIAEAIEDDDSS